MKDDEPVYVNNYCEELNNSPQILAAAAIDGLPLTRYAANTRSNGTAGRENLENSFIYFF